MYSGIHFRAADVQGARMGERIARYRERHHFRPLRGSTDWEHDSGEEG